VEEEEEKVKTLLFIPYLLIRVEICFGMLHFKSSILCGVGLATPRIFYFATI
jgi:hypothetical protein